MYVTYMYVYSWEKLSYVYDYYLSTQQIEKRLALKKKDYSMWKRMLSKRRDKKN